jgi:hypothetical protein
MKADLRISVKEYYCNNNLKILTGKGSGLF